MNKVTDVTEVTEVTEAVELDSPVAYDTVITDVLVEMATTHGGEVFKVYDSVTGVTAIYKRANSGAMVVVAKVHKRGNNSFFPSDWQTWGEVEYIDGDVGYHSHK